MDGGLDRARIDDPSLGFLQLLQEGTGHVEQAVHIDRDGVFPVLPRGVGGEPGAAHDAGIVEQDRGRPAEIAPHPAGELLAGVGIGHVHLIAARGRADLAGDRVGLRAHDIDGSDLRPGLRQHMRGAAADAGAAAGNDGDMAVEQSLRNDHRTASSSTGTVYMSGRRPPSAKITWPVT